MNKEKRVSNAKNLPGIMKATGLKTTLWFININQQGMYFMRFWK